MPQWIDGAIFYHIYPLGLLGAPARNDEDQEVEHRLPRLREWGPHAASLGCNAIYLGPVFESTSHGYDSIDYARVDRRLGDNQDLVDLIAFYRQLGMRVVLDGVFNHVSREFPAFQDLLERGEDSPFRDWFVNVDFGQRSPLGDPFSYYAYEGNFDLVKLNLHNPKVREYLFDVAQMWFREFAIDGIRFDAVDGIDHGFLKDFAAVCREANPDCWLMGEVVNGDYRQWTEPGELDSCTNYEAFKGLYSSFNDRNLFEIAWSLNREFGPDGVYRHLRLYSFADNHDVNRVASLLHRSEDLASLYAILFTMPGVPSIYYGSEWGISADKGQANDMVLRPALNLPASTDEAPHPWLAGFISQLGDIRQRSLALRHGDFRQLYVSPEQFAFQRRADDDVVIVIVNAWAGTTQVEFETGLDDGFVLVDGLDPDMSVAVASGQLRVAVPPNSTRILAGRQ
ncbi:MAG: alpha-amylase family glycosyl hydrolase [Chloroflexota bacterium]|nr:alpha-amylase family glycosyl hydrolase [Chloroflexota bacterium]